jgi:hypothetical protein
MSHVTSCVLAATFLACTAATASADQLKSEYDHGVDFFKYQAYSWGTVTAAIPFYVDRIK